MTDIDWRARAEAVEAERDQLLADIQAERDGLLALRRKYGARDDETFEDFVARLAAAREDSARLEWYFSFDPVKPKEFWSAYHTGILQHWSIDQWRAAIDEAMAKK